ncbi:hypothetical protein E2C01_073939 [Portunus trituberculatus]|uniref:Uncharacterized protein n=1 Tax=Portunus trituberculatus TaxID=210409 RepID=A0A5B7I6N8_PORTR|nr:hypothetical protein [Portunus trituberculatus]
MKAPLGSFYAEISYGPVSCHGWIDVHSSLSAPLLFWELCRDLRIVPKDFPKQIRARHTTTSGHERTHTKPSATKRSCHEAVTLDPPLSCATRLPSFNSPS